MSIEFRMIKKTNIPNAVELVEKLSKTTHFTKMELVKLLFLYKELKGVGEKMRRQCLTKFFFEQFDFCDEMLSDIIARVVNFASDSTVSAQEFITSLSILMRGSFEEKNAFCFKVYDISNKTTISRTDLMMLMRKAILKNSSEDDPEEFFKELLEMTFKKLDVSANHKITFSDYCKAIYRQPEMMQALGIILPDDMQIRAFEMAYFGIQSFSPPWISIIDIDYFDYWFEYWLLVWLLNIRSSIWRFNFLFLII